jgi:transcriptional regulator with XRE-family HTH domain
MKHSSEKLLTELRQSPEYAAERLALELIGHCELRRTQLGWSYAQLARQMGVSRTYISKLMSGTQNSTLGSLVKLAHALDCDLTLALRAKPASNNGSGRPAQTRVSLISTPRGQGRQPETCAVVHAAKPR